MTEWIQRGTVAAGCVIAWFWATVFAAVATVGHEAWAPTFWAAFGVYAPWTGGIIGSIGLIVCLSALHDAAPAIAARAAARRRHQAEDEQRAQREAERVLKEAGIDV